MLLGLGRAWAQRPTRPLRIWPTSWSATANGRSSSSPRARRPGPAPSKVWRIRDGAGRLVHDYLALRDEPSPQSGAEPLLERVVAGGKRLAAPTLLESRTRFQADFASLTDEAKRLRSPEPPAVVPTAMLSGLQATTQTTVRRRELGES